jgi:hypothetical protein
MSAVKVTEDVASYLLIQFQQTSGDLEPWVASSDRPTDLDSNMVPAPEKSWYAYVAYLNTRGTGNYRLVRRTATRLITEEVL